MLVQDEAVATTVPNCIVPAAPKPLPWIVTMVPMTPCLGDNALMNAPAGGGVVVVVVVGGVVVVVVGGGVVVVVVGGVVVVVVGGGVVTTGATVIE